MKSENILILPGDGVGPEIMKEAIKIIDTLNSSKICNIEYSSNFIYYVAYIIYLITYYELYII